MIFVSGDGTIDAAASDGAVTTVASWSGAAYGGATIDGVVYFSDDKSVYRIDDGIAHAIYTPPIGGVGSDLVIDDAFVYTQTWCNIARISADRCRTTGVTTPAMNECVACSFFTACGAACTESAGPTVSAIP